MLDLGETAYSIMIINLLFLYYSESCKDFYFSSVNSTPTRSAQIYEALRIAQVRLIHIHPCMYIGALYYANP